MTISVAVAMVAVVLVFGVWYSPPLHVAAGVTSIFLLLLAVDVVIGPLLTSVVYRPGKKSLYFDLATIALLQIAAFSYGLWTLAQGRPAWLVYNVDRFDLVQAFELDQRKQNQAAPEYRFPPLLGPRWVAALLPPDAEEKKAILFESLVSGVDLPQHPELYHPLGDALDAMRVRTRPLEELFRYNSQQKVEETLREWPSADGFLPLMARHQPMVVLINKSSGKVLGIVELNPWE